MSGDPTGLRAAWLNRARAAEADLNHAAQAPALFKPEFVEQRQADFAKAIAWARFWDSQAVRSSSEPSAGGHAPGVDPIVGATSEREAATAPPAETDGRSA